MWIKWPLNDNNLARRSTMSTYVSPIISYSPRQCNQLLSILKVCLYTVCITLKANSEQACNSKKSMCNSDTTTFSNGVFRSLPKKRWDKKKYTLSRLLDREAHSETNNIWTKCTLLNIAVCYCCLLVKHPTSEQNALSWTLLSASKTSNIRTFNSAVS